MEELDLIYYDIESLHVLHEFSTEDDGEPIIGMVSAGVLALLLSSWQSVSGRKDACSPFGRRCSSTFLFLAATNPSPCRSETPRRWDVARTTSTLRTCGDCTRGRMLNCTTVSLTRDSNGVSPLSRLTPSHFPNLFPLWASRPE